MIIGIVGKSGSGKSTISKKFLNAEILDLDKISHSELNYLSMELRAKYGDKIILNADDPPMLQKVNRKELSKIVWNKNDLLYLENLLYPRIEQYVNLKIKLSKKSDFVIDGALLHKSSLMKKCDIIIYVKAPLYKRIYRIYKRDDVSLINLFKRIYVQRKIKPSLYENAIIVNN